MSEDPGLKSSSMDKLLQEFDKGVMKTPRVFEGKIHESCPQLPELVDDKRERIDRFWNDAYLRSLNTTISHIQDWFTKISFFNKTGFVRELIQELAESKKLFDVVYFIGPPLKDSVYARTQFTRSAYDVAALDHNRSVEDSLYESQKSHYIEWFRSLNPREQFNAVIGLAHLGGGALQETVYLEAAKILNEKEKNLIRRRVLEYFAFKRKESYNLLASKVADRKKRARRSTSTRKRGKEKLIRSKPSYRHRKEDVEEEEEEADHVVQMRQKIEVFKNAMQAMKDIADGTYTDPAKRKSKSTGLRRSRSFQGDRQKVTSSTANIKGNKKTGLPRLDAGLDRVQMLPLWDNRRIMSLLPDKTMNNTVSVNKYWKDMVDKTKREMRIRRKIDKFLKSSENHRTIAMTRKSVGHKLTKDDRKPKKSVNKREGSLEPKSFSKSPQELDDVFVPEDYQVRLQVSEVFPGPSPKLNPYSKPYNEFVVCDKYCDDRVFDANKRWAAYSCKTDVEFANVVVGGNCNMRIADAHKSRISCLCFHPEGALVFTGGYDGAVKLHDIWKKAVKLVYAGHKGVVESVSANCKYVASCGLDYQIRVSNISDGRCLFCYGLGGRTPCSLILSRCGDPMLYVGSSSGELSMFRVRAEDGSRRVGKTVYAHQGEVTSLHHYPCVILSTGTDGYVRMWTSNFESPHWIVSLLHPTRVNSAVLSYRKVISACEDGKIRIWDVTSGVCERTVLVVKNSRPVLGIVCINTPAAVKLILSNEADIKVVEFPFKKTSRKKTRRITESFLKPVADLKAKLASFEPPISSLDKRMMKLHMRQAVSPPLRPSPNKKSPQHPLLTKTSFIKGRSSLELQVKSNHETEFDSHR